MQTCEPACDRYKVSSVQTNGCGNRERGLREETCANALSSADDEDVFSFEIEGIVFFSAALDVFMLWVEPG